MSSFLELAGVDWSEVSHAYGPATDVPDLIRGLWGADADECISELYGTIAHQGSRYSATSAAVRFLVRAAADSSVAAGIRAGVLMLLDFCANGYFQDRLAWAHQRDHQTPPYERATWDAVAARHAEIRVLLLDGRPEVERSALRVLAWTGDSDEAVLNYIASAVRDPDAVARCAGWLAAVVLGMLPSGTQPASAANDRALAGRFGRAAADLRFSGSRASVESVDLLCEVMQGVDQGGPLIECELVAGEDPERMAAAALMFTPPHLVPHASRRLLALVGSGGIYGENALRAYLHIHLGDPAGDHGAPKAMSVEAVRAVANPLDPLEGWDLSGRLPRSIWELDEFGLPSTPDELAAWVAGRRTPGPTSRGRASPDRGDR